MNYIKKGIFELEEINSGAQEMFNNAIQPIKVCKGTLHTERFGLQLFHGRRISWTWLTPLHMEIMVVRLSVLLA